MCRGRRRKSQEERDGGERDEKESVVHGAKEGVGHEQSSDVATTGRTLDRQSIPDVIEHYSKERRTHRACAQCIRVELTTWRC